jgi:hypothetical protein
MIKSKPEGERRVGSPRLRRKEYVWPAYLSFGCETGGLQNRIQKNGGKL